MRFVNWLARVMIPADRWTTQDCDEVIARLERKREQLTDELIYWRRLRMRLAEEGRRAKF